MPSQLSVELALLLLDRLVSVSSAPFSYALQGAAEPTGRSPTFDAHQATSRLTPEVCKPQEVEGTRALTVGGCSKLKGAEQDLTWRSIVPSSDGEVVEVTTDRLRVVMSTGRKQSYPLRGLLPYVSPGSKFVGKASILAGTVPRMVDITTLRHRQWNAVDDLASDNATDRYVAAKALGVSAHAEVTKVRELLYRSLVKEAEHRAASLARLHDDRGFEFIADAIKREHPSDLRYLPMEAVLILSEITSPRAAAILDHVAGDRSIVPSELRQAAVWGLGKAGIGAYSHVVKYIDDENDDVVLHAIVSLGEDVTASVVETLIGHLTGHGSTRLKAAASEALRLIASPAVLRALLPFGINEHTSWTLATLGRLPVRLLANTQLAPDVLKAIQPVQLLAEGENWLVSRTVATSFQFLLLQTLAVQPAPCVTTSSSR